jgi:hypothetical protein
MKPISLMLGTIAAIAAPAVFAQAYIEMPAPHTERGYVYVPVDPANPVGPVNPDALISDPYWTGRPEHGLNDGRRADGYYYYDNRGAYDNRYDNRSAYRNRDMECWNPRARHYEEVRAGERQDDLDFNRCRSTRRYR